MIWLWKLIPICRKHRRLCNRKKYSFESYIERPPLHWYGGVLPASLEKLRPNIDAEIEPAAHEPVWIKPCSYHQNGTYHFGNRQNTCHWAVISEPWCGDDSQIVPCINKVAGRNSMDVYCIENLALYLQFSSVIPVSIPTVDLLWWCYRSRTEGPRPTQQLVADDAKAAGIPRDYMISPEQA